MEERWVMLDSLADSMGVPNMAHGLRYFWGKVWSTSLLPFMMLWSWHPQRNSPLWNVWDVPVCGCCWRCGIWEDPVHGDQGVFLGYIRDSRRQGSCPTQIGWDLETVCGSYQFPSVGREAGVKFTETESKGCLPGAGRKEKYGWLFNQYRPPVL